MRSNLNGPRLPNCKASTPWPPITQKNEWPNLQAPFFDSQRDHRTQLPSRPLTPHPRN
jgi:hypothetical protein